jgi:hypothetical protein
MNGIAQTTSERRYVLFCRGAAVAFALVVVYTLAVKIPTGGLQRDWLHTVLHMVSGGVALYLGWTGSVLGARLYTLGIMAVYGLLGVVGWFIDGVALESAFRIPLSAADNVFHLSLALVALATWIAAQRKWPTTRSGPRLTA